MRKIDIKKIKLNALSIFFLFMLAMQFPGVIAFLFEKTVETNVSTSVLMKVFLDINKFFSGNWIALSIFSLGLIPLNSLYYSIINAKNDIESITKNNERNYFSYVLCVSNIFLYGNFFDLDCIKSNYEIIKANVILFLIIIVVLALFNFGLRFLAKYITARRYRGDVINEIVSREEENRRKIEQKNRTQTDDNSKEKNANMGISDYELSKDKNEILKHPFVYAFESYKFFYARKKALKYDGKLKRKKYRENRKNLAAQQKSIEGNVSIVFFVISGLIFAMFIFAIVGGVLIKEPATDGQKISVIEEILNYIANFFSNLTNGLETTEPKVIDFLMVFGVIILLFISYIFIVYAFTYMYRVWMYLGKNAKNYFRDVSSLINTIEKLFTNTVNEVVRLLLFIPDALKSIIDIFDD